MTLKKYLFLIIFATAICGGGLVIILLFVNPYDVDSKGLLLFYAALFLTLLGIFSILGFVFRFLLKRNEFIYYQVKTAMRQGSMLALLLTSILFLQASSLLVWWNSLLLVLFLTGIEYLFIVQENKKIDN